MKAAHSPLFSKESDVWGTPLDLFKQYDAEFNFTVDGAANQKNHLCRRYFRLPDNNALTTACWVGERVWLNPPYSQTAEFLQRAVDAVIGENALVCVLIPSRTDTRYFHDFVYDRDNHRWHPWVKRVDFLKGRVKFVADTLIRKGTSNSAPFPSIVVVMEMELSK